MIEGVVLAGGYSSRFSSNKLTKVYQGEPLIMHTINSMLSVCDRIVVISGHYHQEILQVLQGVDKVEVIYNELYSQGMFTSVLKGANSISHDFFIIPGDYPFIGEEVYKALLKGEKAIRVPSFNHRLGHPIFIKAELIESLRNTKATNLKDFRNQYDYEIINVNDQYILKDIDTIEDFKRILERD
ncbi:MAG: nucleotidyltransferase family protein [Candidatus Izemoplasmatales bacterium]|jgi:molybdenum cofactor cytidylyltransferase